MKKRAQAQAQGGRRRATASTPAGDPVPAGTSTSTWLRGGGGGGGGLLSFALVAAGALLAAAVWRGTLEPSTAPAPAAVPGGLSPAETAGGALGEAAAGAGEAAAGAVLQAAPAPAETASVSQRKAGFSAADIAAVLEVERQVWADPAHPHLSNHSRVFGEGSTSKAGHSATFLHAHLGATPQRRAILDKLLKLTMELVRELDTAIHRGFIRTPHRQPALRASPAPRTPFLALLRWRLQACSAHRCTTTSFFLTRSLAYAGPGLRGVALTRSFARSQEREAGWGITGSSVLSRLRPRAVESLRYSLGDGDGPGEAVSQAKSQAAGPAAGEIGWHSDFTSG